MISNTAQINTFYGGMNTDSAASMLPSNQYRFGQDVRIITDDSSTSGVLQSVEGAKKYNYGIKSTEEIIGTATINDIAVRSGTGRRWRVTPAPRRSGSGRPGWRWR